MITSIEDLIASNTKNKTEMFDFGMVDNEHVINLYGDMLQGAKKEVSLDTKDIARYNNRPRLLSYDLYGTKNYWYYLLYINNIPTPSEFVISDTIYVLDEYDILKFIKYIKNVKVINGLQW